MVDMSESNKSFVGLLLYAGSHLFCIYYLLWILLSYITHYPYPLTPLEQEVINLQVYFPNPKYRIVLPLLVFGTFALYSLVSFVLMQSKRLEKGSKEGSMEERGKSRRSSI